MQSINDTVRNPVFALSFFGALLALPVAAALHARVHPARARWLTAAAILYVVGGFGVTFAFNVPLNDELAALDLASASPAEVAGARSDYEDAWNAWNAVRTVASTLALICVAAAALSRSGAAGYEARCSSRACGGSSMPSRAGTASGLSGSPSR
jgi:uncharacterized membrane protein